ncbi:MAG: lipoyl synthase [Chloroflexi bacterium]|nr:lipoyl synthase [Chloroflexota bacterium]
MTNTAQQRLPPWFKVRLPGGPGYLSVQRLLRDQKLHTVCEEAHCPNIGECFESGTATFLILGDTCTRNCGFCAVGSGRPLPPDPQEPENVARSVQSLGLKYAVITSVTRDDLPDGGAGVFAATIRRIRELCPACRVEVLIPDFRGSAAALSQVMAACPDVLNHNVETVPRLYPRVRPKAVYQRSLEVLSKAKALSADALTKSGIMVGLGETREELRQAMADLRSTGCDLLTIGQYLRPSSSHLPVERFYTPEEFVALRDEAMSLGFRQVESGPLVRSSYHAARTYACSV